MDKLRRNDASQRHIVGLADDHTAFNFADELRDSLRPEKTGRRDLFQRYETE